MVVFRTRAPSDLPAAEFADRAAGPAVRPRSRGEDNRAGDAPDWTTALPPAAPATRSARPASAPTARPSCGRARTRRRRPLSSPARRRTSPTTCGAAWRTGPSAPTRRITGVSDPDDAGCPPEGSFLPTGDPTTTGLVLGPARPPGGHSSRRGASRTSCRRMSADGRQVAFLTGPAPRPDPTVAAGQLDVYVTDMSQGVTRKAGTTELTREASGVTTSRSSRSRSRATVAGSRSEPRGPCSRFQLHGSRPRRPCARVRSRTCTCSISATMEFERVTYAFDGGITNGAAVGGVGTLAMSRDGSRLAFVSGASNLYFGDSNSAAGRLRAFGGRPQRGRAGAPPASRPSGDRPTHRRGRRAPPQAWG